MSIPILAYRGECIELPARVDCSRIWTRRGLTVTFGCTDPDVGRISNG